VRKLLIQFKKMHPFSCKAIRLSVLLYVLVLLGGGISRLLTMRYPEIYWHALQPLAVHAPQVGAALLASGIIPALICDLILRSKRDE